MSKIKTSELNDKSEYGLGSYDFFEGGSLTRSWNSKIIIAEKEKWNNQREDIYFSKAIALYYCCLWNTMAKSRSLTLRNSVWWKRYVNQ